MPSETIHNQSKNDDEAAVFDDWSILSHPDEILCEIFEYLSIINRVAIIRVSKLFGRIAMDVNGRVKSLFTTPDKKEPDWSHKLHISFCPVKDHQFLENWVFVPNFEILVNVIKALPNLKALHIENWWENAKELFRDFPGNVNLEHIGIDIHRRDDGLLSTLDFAVDRLENSKVTCILENWIAPMNRDKIEQLPNIKYMKHFMLRDTGLAVGQWRSVLQNGLLGCFGVDLEPMRDKFWTSVFENGSMIEYLDDTASGTNLEDSSSADSRESNISTSMAAFGI